MSKFQSKMMPAFVTWCLAFFLAAPVWAGSDTDFSGNTIVDTQDAGNRPIVQDVTSAYCGRMCHVYFLNGVSLSVTFTANINWNG